MRTGKPDRVCISAPFCFRTGIGAFGSNANVRLYVGEVMELSRDELGLILKAIHELDRQTGWRDKSIRDLTVKLVAEARDRDSEEAALAALRRKGYRPLSAEEAAAFRAAWCQAPE